MKFLKILAVVAGLLAVPLARATETTWEPNAVASGTAVDFRVDTSGYRSLWCQMRTSNEAGGASHVFTPVCTDKSFAANYSTFGTVTVTTNSFQRVAWDPDVLNTVTDATNTRIYQVKPCRYMKFTAPAANGITQIQCTGYGVGSR